MNKNREDILSALVSYETVSGNRDQIHDCIGYIEDLFSDLPLLVKKFSHGGVESIFFQSQTEGERVLLNAHLDVVPGSKELFTLKKKDGRLIGRGVSDMKFAIACFYTAVHRLYEKNGTLPPIDLLFTSDEEVGGINGVGHFVATEKIDYATIIIPDGGDNWHIVEEAKGVAHIRLRATGKSAHASRPWEGSSAADLLIQDLFALRNTYPQVLTEKWQTTLTIGQVHAGKQTNQVTDNAEAFLDFRYVSPDTVDAILTTVQRICKHCSADVLIQAPIHHVNRNNPYVQAWSRLLPVSHDVFVNETGASDGRYFASTGIPVIISKPVNGGIHTEHEWLDAAAFEEFENILFHFLSDFPHRV